jgi:long-chain fatty acid transport protein
MPLKGQFIRNGTALADTKANLNLPQIITGAIALWPVRDQEREWKLELDVDHVRWKSFRNTTVDLSTPNALGTPAIPFPLNWRDSYNVMLGTEYRWLKLEQMPDWEVALRGGYMHLQTQMPDQTFNPGIPSADQHIPSFGVGFVCKEKGSFFGLTNCGNLGLGAIKPKAVGLDFSYQVAFYEDRTVVGNTVNPAINGTYKTTIQAGGVTIRMNF